jgi:hypothetical protein
VVWIAFAVGDERRICEKRSHAWSCFGAPMFLSRQSEGGAYDSFYFLPVSL